MQPAKGADLRPLPYAAGLGKYMIPPTGNGEMEFWVHCGEMDFPTWINYIIDYP